MHKFRKIVSFTSLWAFGLLILTSIVLYIVPAGRVAYWADWRLWGLTKTRWAELHINLGVLFLAAGGLHIYLNWNHILVYMKNRARQLRIFTRDFNIAMAVTVLVMLGTLLQVPPFSTVIGVGNSIKDAGAVKYGEPPYGHAELSSLQAFSEHMGWKPDQSMERLKQNGFAADTLRMTLKDLAARYGVTPQQIYLAMQPPIEPRRSSGLPDSPPPGIGRRTLADIGQAYQLDIPDLIKKLESEKISARADQTIKQVAERHQIEPQELYALLKRLGDV